MIAEFNFDPNSQRFASHPGRSNLVPFLAFVRANYHLTKVSPTSRYGSGTSLARDLPQEKQCVHYTSRHYDGNTGTKVSSRRELHYNVA